MVETKRKRKNVVEAEKVIIVPDEIPAELQPAEPRFYASEASKAQKMKNYNLALKSLDDHVMEALDGLYELMRDDDKYVRLRAIEIVLKKVIPEKKIKEVVGADGGPIQVNNNIDIRALIFDAAAALDGIDLDDLRERSKNGSLKIIDTHSGRTEEEEG